MDIQSLCTNEDIVNVIEKYKKMVSIRMQLKRGREMLHEKLKGDYFNE